MRRNGVIPSMHTFPSLLKSFSNSKQNPFKLLSHIFKFGMDSDPFVRNSLISVLFSSLNVELARQVFDESTQTDVVSWTALINGYLKSGYLVEGLECFNEMRLKGVEVCGMSVVGVLAPRCCREKGAIVDMYSKCGFHDDARKYFDQMPIRNVVSWTALIAGHLQGNRYNEAVILFQGMLMEKVRPSEFTFTSVLTACAEIGALIHGRWVHGRIIRFKWDRNSAVGTALINMYAKCGCLKEAFMVFKKLSGKDVYAWTAMINGFAMHGDAMSSLNLFNEMLRSGVHPNEVTSLGVLNACSHGGLVDKGREIFATMKKRYRLEPGLDHYSCMVDMLGRAGLLEEAREMILDMPIEPTARVWAPLLGACMIHKAYDLGEYVGKHLIKLQPERGSRYALLATLYSRRQKWDSAAEIRKIMKERGVKKTPGCSWIEINGAIHEFTAFDYCRPEYYRLNEMIESFMVEMRLDCSLFASDVGTKEQSLEYFPPEVLEGVSTVKPPVVVIEEAIAKWDCVVVGQFIGDAPNFGYMQRIVEILWGKASHVKNGHWHIQNKPLVLRKWEPNLRKLDFDLKRMPVWVQLYNVPLELFSRVGLSYIASAVGNPLYMDYVTASKERLEFAKVCVEVEAGEVIHEVIHVVLRDGSIARIRVYAPWFPKICLQCNTFGHLASSYVEVLKASSKTKETKDTHIWRKKVNSSVSGNAGKERLEHTSTTMQVEKILADSPGTDGQVGVGDLLPNLAIQGSKLESMESVVVHTQSPGNADITNPVEKVYRSDVLVDTAGDKIIPKDMSCGGEFPSLQDSLNQKRKARGKKKDNVGSSSKLDALIVGGVS
ncbi:Pentatricopeptide repeat-containing protein [Hibiscus syriacus]|uniref:Pentatricopeptide repeat-containing protein n=1 Tax=Hibiscus syriacus TaxID=106335 RepID=A0A6A2YRN9_HIBSY|nr:Pentatricopeptide repeat-containing protein [Hibiscus syriacus]